MCVRTLAGTATAGAVAATVLALPAAADSSAARARPYEFNGDGYRDLAVGLPLGDPGGVHGAGYVAVVPGSAAGPVKARAFTVSQSSPGIPGASERYDLFGEQVASSDLNSDGYAEMIVSALDESGTHDRGGRITILWGARSGFSSGTIVPRANEAADGFGGNVRLRDHDGDGHPDLVVGVPWEDAGTAESTGRVLALPGAAAGVTATGSASYGPAGVGLPAPHAALFLGYWLG